MLKEGRSLRLDGAVIMRAVAWVVSSQTGGLVVMGRMAVGCGAGRLVAGWAGVWTHGLGDGAGFGLLGVEQGFGGGLF